MPNRALIRFISVVHRELYRASRGLVGGHTGGPVLLLTTVGRKSGRRRTTPLLYVQEGTNWIVVGSNGGDDCHPAWWLNLKADANATIQVKGKVERVRAREATEEETAALWPRFVEMYSHYETYRRRTSRQIPVVILEPV